jgi:hypothetical protein
VTVPSRQASRQASSADHSAAGLFITASPYAGKTR